MKNSSVTILLTFAISWQIMAQDSLDFLDKVNDKPKSTTTVKQKEEAATTVTKKVTDKAVATTPTKKKRSKKSSSKATSLATETNANLNSNPTQINSTQTTVLPLNSEPKNVSEPAQKVEEDVSVSGLWIDPKIYVEPDGLPGFGGDATLIRSQNSDGKSLDSSGSTTANKPLFSFSEFFDKYKKAMLILGFIILFAFYRLRMARPSSSSNNRPYRR